MVRRSAGAELWLSCVAPASLHKKLARLSHLRFISTVWLINLASAIIGFVWAPNAAYRIGILRGFEPETDFERVIASQRTVHRVRYASIHAA